MLDQEGPGCLGKELRFMAAGNIKGLTKRGESGRSVRNRLERTRNRGKETNYKRF